MTQPRPVSGPVSFAVCRPARTGNGDPVAVLIAEKATQDAARFVALTHLDAYPHVWVELWRDLPYDPERSRLGKPDGRVRDRAKIVERFHRREMVTANG